MTVTEPTPADDDPGAVAGDDDAPVPVAASEPTPDDPAEHGDAVELVRTGLVRFHIGDRVWRLRRPFFGELKTLRLAWEDIVDGLADDAIRAQAIAQQNAADYSEIQGNDDISFVDKAEQILELRKLDRDVGRQMARHGDDLRIGWWRQAFDMLSVEHPDKAPPDLPAWFAAGRLPGQVLQHWRSVPLGRG